MLTQRMFEHTQIYIHILRLFFIIIWTSYISGNVHMIKFFIIYR